MTDHPYFTIMKKPEELIHIKCDNCGEIFTTPRKDLDQIKVVMPSITSSFFIVVQLPHPVFTHVRCEYTITAEKGDYCNKCCLEFLETGLIALKQQCERGTL